jgi:hypothetical protein
MKSNDKEKLQKIRDILCPAITWYRENKNDENLVYDESIERFHELTRGECVDILEIISSND